MSVFVHLFALVVSFSFVKADTATGRFTIDGFEFPIRVFTDDEALQIKGILDKVEIEEYQGRFHSQTMNLHLTHREIWKWIQHPNLLSMASEVSGLPKEDLLIMASTIFVKYPAAPGENASGTVGWHQDLTYWNLEPQEAFTTWVAVDPVTEERGCMEILPKAHEKVLKHELQENTVDNILMNKQAIPESLMAIKDRVCVELAPGHMSVHGGWTPHTSKPNKSSKRRLGIVVNWIPKHVQLRPSLYNLTEYPEWRLPVSPTDEGFPPKVVRTPRAVADEL